MEFIENGRIKYYETIEKSQPYRFNGLTPPEDCRILETFLFNVSINGEFMSMCFLKLGKECYVAVGELPYYKVEEMKKGSRKITLGDFNRFNLYSVTKEEGNYLYTSIKSTEKMSKIGRTYYVFNLKSYLANNTIISGSEVRKEREEQIWNQYMKQAERIQDSKTSYTQNTKYETAVQPPEPNHTAEVENGKTQGTVHIDYASYNSSDNEDWDPEGDFEYMPPVDLSVDTATHGSIADSLFVDEDDDVPW